MRYEAEIDSQLADLFESYARANVNVDRAIDTLHYIARDKKVYKTRNNWHWALDLATVLEFVPTYPMDRERQAATIKALEDAREQAAVLLAQIQATEAKYTGWSRFFLVQNAGGHIHKSRNCSTCFPTTQYGWLPQLSGLTEADAVAEQGPRLCSVCFPSAPVEWTIGVQTEKSYCAGSDTAVSVSGRAKYVRCPVCSKTVGVTKYGQLRKHQAA